MFVLRGIADADGANQFAKLGMCWKCVFAAANHQLALQLDGEWFLAVDHIAGSAAVLWPLERRPLPGMDGFWFEPSLSVRRPVLKPILDLEVPACNLEIVSWAGQCRRRPALMLEWTPGLRMFQQGGVKSLVAIGAENAFWDFGKATLVNIARTMNIEIRAGASLVDILFDIVCQVLDISGEAAIQTVSRRHNIDHLSANYHPAILEVDEALQCLDMNDHKDFKQQKVKARERNVERASFQVEFRQKADKVRALAKTLTRGRAKAKAAPVRRNFPTVVSQADAKTLIPPGTSIWRASSHCAWAGHCPPFARISSSWAMGEPEAMKDVIRRLWLAYNGKNGLDANTCPFDGLL